jgi:phosphoglycolate phosphatase-like HAD superfamily hydrolase
MDIRLILFDIDGTLLDVHGAGRQAFADALEAVFGWRDDIHYIRFDGATDLDILRKIMTRRGVVSKPTDEERFFKRLPYDLERTTSSSQLTLHPGVKELLTALSNDPRALVGLVTGNIESCARVKLKKFDLHGHFLLGAFGHEHASRGQIAALALLRARQQIKPGQQIAARFLVGDTPADIEAAEAIGARSIAVATGAHDREALRKAGADHVLSDLSDLPAVLRILGLQGGA